MKQHKFILFPLLRDIQIIPPTISIINYLAKEGYQIILFTYFTKVNFIHPNIEVIKYGYIQVNLTSNAIYQGF